MKLEDLFESSDATNEFGVFSRTVSYTGEDGKPLSREEGYALEQKFKKEFGQDEVTIDNRKVTNFEWSSKDDGAMSKEEAIATLKAQLGNEGFKGVSEDILERMISRMTDQQGQPEDAFFTDDVTYTNTDDVTDKNTESFYTEAPKPPKAESRKKTTKPQSITEKEGTSTKGNKFSLILTVFIVIAIAFQLGFFDH